ncbi:hypothetical protein D3C75_232740 [compost metagenome]
MKTAYKLYHIMPDKSKKLIADVRSADDVQYHIETPKYAGTWLSPTRKLLRFGRGEVRIEEYIVPPSVVNHKLINTGAVIGYDLEIIDHKHITTIRVEHDRITGFVQGHIRLWETDSFTELANLAGKELAYACYEYHELLLKQFNLSSAI